MGPDKPHIRFLLLVIGWGFGAEAYCEGAMNSRKLIDRRAFLRSAGACAAGMVAAGNPLGRLDPAFSAAKASRPNILLILADDMGYSDIACFGGEMRTPNIDRLAQGGLRFTHFHNASRCCPSRASLLTGLYPHQAGIGDMMNDQGVDGYRGDLNDRCVTIAEVLKGAGYGTYMAGKWHVTRFIGDDGPKHNWPLQRGFDRYFGTITGAASYFEPDTLTGDNTRIEPPANFYYTDGIADHAVSYIRDHRRNRPDKPFFLYAAFTAPHWPLHALEEDIARIRGRFDQGWDVLRSERRRRMIEMGIVREIWRLSPRDGNVPAWETAPDKAWQLRRMEVYAAQIDRLDQGVGRILGALEQTGARENTLIFFLSDNGGCHEELTPSWGNYLLEGKERVARKTTRDGKPVRFFNNPSVMPGPADTYQSYGYPWANVSNTPFRLFKHWTHEGGIATPLIMNWPAGIKGRGDLRRQPGHIIDIMSTCVDVSGAAYPAERAGRQIQPMEGKSLVPAFADKALDREAIYCEHEGNRAVITPRWKLVARGAQGAWELYDMIADRTEMTDLAAQNPGIVEPMTGMWDAWARRTRVFPRPGSTGR